MNCKRIAVAGIASGQSSNKPITADEISKRYEYSLHKRNKGLTAKNGFIWATIVFVHLNENKRFTIQVKKTLNNQSEQTKINYFNGLYLAVISAIESNNIK